MIRRAIGGVTLGVLPFLGSCQAPPAPPAPPVLRIVGREGNVPIVVATSAGKVQSLELRIEHLESYVFGKRPETLAPLPLLGSPGEEIALGQFDPGEYRATLAARHRSPEAGTLELESEPVTFRIPRQVHIVEASDVLGPDVAPIDLRVRLVLHPEMAPNDRVASVTRAAVDAAFTQTTPLRAKDGAATPWEELELNRLRVLEASGQEELLPEMDPQVLLVVDHRPADPVARLPEQIVARLYDLSFRGYDYVGREGKELQMHRALIFQEYVEVTTRSEEATAGELLDAWRRWVGALRSSRRFQGYLGALRAGQRLTEEGPQAHLLGDIPTTGGEEAHHAFVERAVLFPADGAVVPVEPRTEPVTPERGSS